MRMALVIPVYGNEEFIPALLDRVELIDSSVEGELEAVFVVDGSPDRSLELLRRQLPERSFRSQLLAHSRNFGSFAAIRTGLMHADADVFAVMAADLQEPTQLTLDFFEALTQDRADLVVGTRAARADAWSSKLASRIFWGLYRRIVQRDIPSGGVDVIGCNRAFRDSLVSLGESNSSLVGLAFWLGYRRETIEYERLEREHGSSGWTFRRKLRYMSDSIYAFTDLPLRLFVTVGLLGMLASLLVAVYVLVGYAAGAISVPGYTVTVLLILFFGALNLLGLGVIGGYMWRTFENTKQRPGAVVVRAEEFGSSRAGT